MTLGCARTNAILRMGTKKVLDRTRPISWEVNTRLHLTPLALHVAFSVRQQGPDRGC